MIVVVLGVHHSGTSIFSRVLHQLGVYMGDNVGVASQMAKGARNVRSANWEDFDISIVTRDIVRAAGGDWLQPPAVEEVWQIVDQDRSFGRRIKTILEERSKREVWGFKVPLAACIMPVMHHFLVLYDSPRYVVTGRRRERVTESMINRFGKWSKHEGRDWGALHDLYYNRIAAFVELYHPSVLHVRHEELIDRSKAKSVVRSMAEFCGLSFKEEAMEGIEYGI